MPTAPTRRAHACAPPPMPADMSIDLADWRWARDAVGQSGGAVYRLHGRFGSPDLFLKHGRDAVADRIGKSRASTSCSTNCSEAADMAGLDAPPATRTSAAP